MYVANVWVYWSQKCWSQGCHKSILQLYQLANILFPLSMARWLNCDTFLNGCDCRNQIQKYLTNCHKITQKRPAWKVLGFRTFPEVKMRKEREQGGARECFFIFLGLDVQTTLSEEDVSSSSNVHRKLDFSFLFFWIIFKWRWRAHSVWWVHTLNNKFILQSTGKAFLNKAWLLSNDEICEEISPLVPNDLLFLVCSTAQPYWPKMNQHCICH